VNLAIPAFIRNDRRLEAGPSSKLDMDDDAEETNLEIPAFMRRQAE
jgi:hypothetical protein